MDNRETEIIDIPQWLLRDQQYNPQSDRDTFINKSILSLLAVLSRIKARSTGKAKKYSVQAAFKVACTLVLVVLLSLSGNFTFVIIINVYLLAVLSSMEAKEIVKILKISCATAFFTFIILVPAVLWGNTYSSIMITSKVFATVTAVSILSHSTKWTDITSALKRFFVPDIFILVLDITLKYIVMLGDFALNMFYALKLRSVGRNRSKYTALSGIAGTLFIKSKEMAEEMYYAMECRGFTGEYHVYSNFKFTIADFAYIVIHIGIFILFLYVGRT